MRDNERIYLWPPPWMMNVLLDAAELQNGRVVLDDTEAGSGTLAYTIEMYGKTRELRYTITAIARNRSRVRLEVSGVQAGREPGVIRRQFALLESLMTDPAEV